jgi:hypothetical protein
MSHAGTLTLDDLFAGIVHFAVLHPIVLWVFLAFCLYKSGRAIGVGGGPPRSVRRRDGGSDLPPSYRVPPAPPRPPAPPKPPKPAYRLPGHPANCSCGLCNPAAPAAAAVTQMPPPSDEIAPPSFERPCAHARGVEAVRAGGELMRYTCRNGRCYATWAPGTRFPAGTAIHDPEA